MTRNSSQQKHTSTTGSHGATHRGETRRLLGTLERLLQLDATHLTETLNAAAQVVGEAVGAEKVDLFLYHPENHTLQVAGLSQTPMSRREVELELDRIALAEGGRIAGVFETGAALTADSTPGHGARFTLRLPLATDAPLP